MEWTRLLNLARRRTGSERGKNDGRTEGERDYDRILFCTPVRRLADKTQVFPLEKHDSVRTRLTHSLEVSNLCRSVGTTLAFSTDCFDGLEEVKRNVPAILAAAGLAHDLGNPPFGHQGEEAIKRWFELGADDVLAGLPENERADFLRFDGNAQTLRILAKLQVIDDDYGLNLTCATLGALMKYSVTSIDASGTSENTAAKKPGYFLSETNMVEEVREATGISEGVRHPFAFIVEACDDIAYTVMDVEDAVKKNFASYPDIAAWVQTECAGDPIAKIVLKQTDSKFATYGTLGLSSTERDDITMQMFRVYALRELMGALTPAITGNINLMLEGRLQRPLTEVFEAAQFLDRLAKFNKTQVYQHRSILEVELHGHNTLSSLMTYFWKAITEVAECRKKDQKASPFQSYVYSLMSENYRRVFESGTARSEQYRKTRLLTDMIAGMTDTFAMDLCRNLKERDA